MALLPFYLRRAAALLKMNRAISSGISASGFLRKLKFTTGGYSRTTFLADWRMKSGREIKKDRFKHVRRDRRPPISAMVDVEWDRNEEYMYHVRVFSRKGEGEPLTGRIVSFSSDIALTPREVEEGVIKEWIKKKKYKGAIPERAQTLAGFRNLLANTYIER